MGKKLLIMILLGAFCVSACGNSKQEKIEASKQSQQLAGVQAEELGQLHESEIRAKMAEAKKQSLARLDELKRLSAENYYQADLNTQVVEQREREKAIMRNVRVQVEAKADEKFATHKQNLEDTYQLKLFNLRMQLESLRMRPKERVQKEEEIATVRAERELKLQELARQRQAYIDKQLQLYQENHKIK